MKFVLGDTLKNGATVIAFDDKTKVVLAGSVAGRVNEYITWSIDEDGNCYHGHYFASIQEAVKDFTDRRCH